VKCRYCDEFLDRPVRASYAPPKKTSTCLIVILVGIAVFFFIAIIAAIAIPNLLESKTAANEAYAISRLRTISAAQELFYARYERYGTLDELDTANMVDSVLARAIIPEKAASGYYYRLSVGQEEWSCTALPARPGRTGTRSFFIDETGVIYFSRCNSTSDPPADVDSPVLGGSRSGG